MGDSRSSRVGETQGWVLASDSRERFFGDELCLRYEPLAGRWHELCPSAGGPQACLICVSFARAFPRGQISWLHTGWSVRFKGKARAERATVPCTAVEPLSRYSQARLSGLKTVVLYTAQTVKRDERERWESFWEDFQCTCVFTRAVALSRSGRTTFGWFSVGRTAPELQE